MCELRTMRGLTGGQLEQNVQRITGKGAGAGNDLLHKMLLSERVRQWIYDNLKFTLTVSCQEKLVNKRQKKSRAPQNAALAVRLKFSR